MDGQPLIPHLFRTEFSKICSVLCKLFGITHIEVAEDITSETFLSALEVWPYKGIPENPTAWLYTVAKNKAKNYLTRNDLFARKIALQVKTSSPGKEELDIDLSDKNIADSQLQMLFAICLPSISAEAQIALALRILCGFGIDEIANAFLTNKETINKRLFRAKEKLRVEKISIRFPAPAELNGRLENILTTLYLLFNEGYYSESNESIIREELCMEAMRLTFLLIENQQTNTPNVNALFALMCFHASRLEARKDSHGEIVLYQEQDERLWNQLLITRGAYHLSKSSQGSQLSKYHLEASIAFWHTIKNDTKDKWQNILQLYNRLLQIEYSPIAALNRTFALAKTNGNYEAIIEAEKLQLTGNQYYYTLLGELYKPIDQKKAKDHFQNALSLSKTNGDRLLLQRKLAQL